MRRDSETSTAYFRRIVEHLRTLIEAEPFGNLTEADKALYRAILAVEREQQRKAAAA